MNRAPRWLIRSKPGLTGAGLTALAGLALWWLIPGLSNLSYDLLFLLRPPQPVSGLCIVEMDENSANSLHEKLMATWDRKHHAHMIQKLVASHARVIVFDVLMDQPSTNDALLLDAISQARTAGVPVILAAKSNPEAPGFATALRSFAELEKLPNWGLAVGEKSTDRVVRRHIELESAAWQSLALSVANAAGQAPPPAGNQTRWINYYGRPRTIPTFSYYRVLDPDFAKAAFSNQVVLIGGGLMSLPFLGGKETDSWPTPWSLLGWDKASGAEVSATACLNYMRGDWLRRSSSLTEAILILGSGLVCGFGLAFSTPRRASALGVLVVGIVAVAALYGMWQKQVWFPWLLVAGVEVPVACGWACLAHFDSLRRRNAALEKTLAVLGADTEHLAGLREMSAGPLAPTRVTTPTFRTSGPLLGPRPSTPAAGGESGAPAPLIPDHELLRRVGRGAYGEVWLARNAIGTFHAVKVVRKETFERSEPFDREFRGLQKFMPISREHPGLVQILHVGRNDADGFFYYVMQAADDEATGQAIDPAVYVPKNLAREIVRRRHLPMTECLALGLDLASALDFLHQEGLIHRDIKPANIIFVRGAPRLADIGLVTTIATPDRAVTYLGTKGFIPPEGPGTPAADVFSLGKVLYEASMGQRAESFPELPATALDRPDTAALFQLNQILLRACHEEIGQRYGSAAELRAGLLELQAQLQNADSLSPQRGEGRREG
ncbi:MAG TPA: serine/threonine-protein kinase [Verrucomicrobiae bacterium]|nr:serine/threonine-protein kinase [Verrucomicrobiae bacterium]